MLLAAIELSCFDTNLTVYYDLQSKNVILNAWLSESLTEEQLYVCKQLDESYYIPQVIIGDAVFTSTQEFFEIQTSIELTLTCDGNMNDPSDPCNNVQTYSAATFEFEFPDFPITISDTVSYYSIELFNHFNCLYDMTASYNYETHKMEFENEANDCSILVAGDLSAGLVDKNLNYVNDDLKITIPMTPNTVLKSSDIAYGELECKPESPLCYSAFNTAIRDNFKNTYIQIKIPVTAEYGGETTVKHVSWLLTVAHIDPTNDINIFTSISIEIMSNAVKILFGVKDNYKDILESQIGGKDITSFIEIITIYINDKVLSMQMSIAQLDLSVNELIQPCSNFDIPDECTAILDLAREYSYQGFFNMQYMNGDEILDSFIFTTDSVDRLCYYQPYFEYALKPCVNLKKTSACLSNQAEKTIFKLVLRNIKNSERITLQSTINFPNDEQEYCFTLSEAQDDKLKDFLAKSSEVNGDLSIGGVQYLIESVINNIELQGLHYKIYVIIGFFIGSIGFSMLLCRLRLFNLPVSKPSEAMAEE